jgi:hypothetical protein
MFVGISCNLLMLIRWIVVFLGVSFLWHVFDTFSQLERGASLAVSPPSFAAVSALGRQRVRRSFYCCHA